MKIVLIGAGSFVFAPTVLRDAIVGHRLDDCVMVLVDLDADLAAAMAGVGRRMADDVGVSTSLRATTDRKEALPGADFVIHSAAVQGRRRWWMDYEILKKEGIPEQARECGGMGGLSYALRSVTLAMEIARDMEDLCPDAPMLVVANPLPRVLSAVNGYSDIRALGFCNAAWHSPHGYRWLADLVDRDPSEVEVTTGGLNHFAWVVELSDACTGENLLPRLEEAVRKGEGRQFETLRRWLDEYGAVGASGPHHMGDFLPLEPDDARRPHPPFHGDEDERRGQYEKLTKIARGAVDWREALLHSSWEHPVDVAAALTRGEDRRFDMINMPNDGYLADLPDGRIVEVPARARGGELRGVEVSELPGRVGELCRTVSDVHQMVARAAVRGDRDMLEAAIDRDPAVTDRDAALRALERMLEAHADILPQFS
jgi:alpha-galactosidase